MLISNKLSHGEHSESSSTTGTFFSSAPTLETDSTLRQACCAGSRIYVQDGIYDKYLALLSKKVAELKVGDPFAADTFQGPQTSQLQYDRIMVSFFFFLLFLSTLTDRLLHRLTSIPVLRRELPFTLEESDTELKGKLFSAWSI